MLVFIALYTGKIKLAEVGAGKRVQPGKKICSENLGVGMLKDSCHSQLLISPSCIWFLVLVSWAIGDGLKLWKTTHTFLLMNLFPDLEPLQDSPIAQLGGPPN